MNHPTGEALRQEIIEINRMFGTDYDPDGGDPAQALTPEAEAAYTEEWAAWKRENGVITTMRSTIWAVGTECAACGLPLESHTLALDLDGRAVAVHRESSDPLPCHLAAPAAIWNFGWGTWLTVEDGPERGTRVQLCFGGVEPDTGSLLGAVCHVPGSRVYRAYGQSYDRTTGVLYEGGLAACRTAVERYAKGGE